MATRDDSLIGATGVGDLDLDLGRAVETDSVSGSAAGAGDGVAVLRAATTEPVKLDSTAADDPADDALLPSRLSFDGLGTANVVACALDLRVVASHVTPAPAADDADVPEPVRASAVDVSTAGSDVVLTRGLASLSISVALRLPFALALS